jgi:hypothetical protein
VSCDVAVDSFGAYGSKVLIVIVMNTGAYVTYEKNVIIVNWS